MRYRNIFVLSPGRSGSKTLATACTHLDNYTSAHESRAAFVGEERFNYPASHIEVDNRLTWFLGALGKRFDDSSTLYVILKRDYESTLDSFLDRLRNSTYRASIMNAFSHGILMKPGDWTADEEREVVKLYLDTIDDNIEEFLKNRRHIRVNLEDGGVSFEAFLKEISASGDLTSARADWHKVFNAR